MRCGTSRSPGTSESCRYGGLGQRKMAEALRESMNILRAENQA